MRVARGLLVKSQLDPEIVQHDTHPYRRERNEKRKEKRTTKTNRQC